MAREYMLPGVSSSFTGYNPVQQPTFHFSGSTPAYYPTECVFEQSHQAKTIAGSLYLTAPWVNTTQQPFDYLYNWVGRFGELHYSNFILPVVIESYVIRPTNRNCICAEVSFRSIGPLPWVEHHIPSCPISAPTQKQETRRRKLSVPLPTDFFSEV